MKASKLIGYFSIFLFFVFTPQVSDASILSPSNTGDEIQAKTKIKNTDASDQEGQTILL